MALTDSRDPGIEPSGELHGQEPVALTVRRNLPNLQSYIVWRPWFPEKPDDIPRFQLTRASAIMELRNRTSTPML